MKKVLYILFLIGALYSCDQEESVYFDEPFVRICTSTGEARTVVLSNVRNTNTYSVYLSSRPITDSLEVSYEVIVGDGLTEDVDYKVVTTANPLVFLPGINDMPIRIRWLKNPVDPTKDNTVTIRLTGNSKGYNLGFPGPDHVQSEVVIEKRNN
ncbi:MAG: hypothetical protein IKH64_08790 [Prevotella sp.]|nr:hypothetical protein [Prevotella sp.]